jgi:capsid protein
MAMTARSLWEPFRAYWARKRLERLRCEAAAALFEAAGPQRVLEDPDAADWRLVQLPSKDADEHDRDSVRARARLLADTNPYARNALTQYRNYVVGAGMAHEVIRRPPAGTAELADEGGGEAPGRVARLWREFLDANEWDAGNRKDWECCWRTWRDGECFLRLFRQPAWPPRVHFVDPEHVAPDPRTGEPAGGIATDPDNVEAPVSYTVVTPGRPGGADRVEHVPAARMLHVKIGVDANVKRGVSLFLPVLDSLRRFQGWLETELIARKLASSVVMVRKHRQNTPAGLAAFADAQATDVQTAGDGRPRRLGRFEPGSIIDVQGFDLELLAPNTHFADASVLGRTILLAVAAGTGLPEYMLTADAANANYASTLVAEGPAVRQFAAWQAFFAGQWRKLFRLVLAEAVRLGLVRRADADRADLRVIPPPLAVRDRHKEAQADALYYDRGALSARELARRDHADPDLMQRERATEAAR